MDIAVRRSFTLIDDCNELHGVRPEKPLRKVAVGLVVENPFAGRKGADLSEMIAFSPELGRQMGEMIVAALGGRAVQSYGKGGIVGLDGEQEHANALLTTTFANPVRDAIGGAKAWISSFTKVAVPGASVDVPMNHIDDVYVRSHYDGMTLTLPGAPMPDEIVLLFCAATGGRINARVGGLAHKDVMARNDA